jgi:hypothetical protein
MWLMNGTTVTSPSFLGTFDTIWSVVGQRDFDGDGKADILWLDTLRCVMGEPISRAFSVVSFGQISLGATRAKPSANDGVKHLQEETSLLFPRA